MEHRRSVKQADSRNHHGVDWDLLKVRFHLLPQIPVRVIPCIMFGSAVAAVNRHGRAK